MNQFIKVFGRQISPRSLFLDSQTNQNNNAQPEESISINQSTLPSKKLQQQSFHERKVSSALKKAAIVRRSVPLQVCDFDPQRLEVKNTRHRYQPRIIPKSFNTSPIYSYSLQKNKFLSQLQQAEQTKKELSQPADTPINYSQKNESLPDSLVHNMNFPSTPQTETNFRPNTVKASVTKQSQRYFKRNALTGQRQRLHQSPIMIKNLHNLTNNAIIFSEIIVDPQSNQDVFLAFETFVHSGVTESDDDKKQWSLLPTDSANRGLRLKTAQSPNFPFNLNHMISKIKRDDGVQYHHHVKTKQQRESKRPGHQFYFDEPTMKPTERITPQIKKRGNPNYFYTNHFTRKTETPPLDIPNKFELEITKAVQSPHTPRKSKTKRPKKDFSKSLAQEMQIFKNNLLVTASSYLVCPQFLAPKNSF